MAKIILTLPTISGGGDSGNTNLSYISSPAQGIVTSDTGTDATIPLADGTNAGLLSSVEKAEIATALQPSDIAGLVPYTGATTDVDLGEFQLKTGQLEFDQTPTGTAGIAKLRWNDSDGTLDLGLKGGNVTLQLGQEQIIRIVNKTGVNLLESAYQVIYISGAQGNRLKVDLALANSDLTSTGTIGLVTETINNNQEGFITSNGLVRGINTTGSLQGETWADGDVLYVSASVAGKLTNVKPIAPQHTVTVGILVSAHATQGSIFVKVDNGYELEELHNVLINTPLNNDALVYETSSGLWKNKTISTALGFTPVNPILNINTTSPLLGGGNLTTDRTLSIQQSTGIQNGYLSSTDWNTFNNKQPAGNYITSLTGEVIASGAGAAVATLSTPAVTGKILTGLNITGGSISATDSILSAFGKVQNQINGVLGGSIFQTTWNASTNTPILTSSIGTKGYYYIVDVAGSTNLDGIIDWKIGDWAIYDGTVWRKVDNTDAVSSVNGFTGAVSLTTSNITEGTNLYYTEGRVSANTDVSANTAVRHNAVTLDTTNGLSLSGQQISLGLSSTSTIGALSSTDWNVFNNKQNALGYTPENQANKSDSYTASSSTTYASTKALVDGLATKQNILTNPISGTGTTNYVPKFTASGTVGNSSITDNGSLVSVTSPQIITDILSANNAALSGSALSVNQTWNTTGNPTTFKINVDDVTSGSSSLLVDFKIKGISSFIIDKNSNLSLINRNPGGLFPSSSGTIRFQGQNNSSVYWSGIESYRVNYGDFLDLRFFTCLATPIERMRITPNGAILINTPTENGIDKLLVNGSTKTTALTLSTAPTTSAGTYDILTRNTSTGIVEKVASSIISSKWTQTGSDIRNNNTGNVLLGASGNAGYYPASGNILGLWVNGSFSSGSIGIRQSNSSTDGVAMYINSEQAYIYGGTTRNMNVGTLKTDGVINASINSVNKTITSNTRFESLVPIKLKNYTVATLPTGVMGDTAYVTDALAPTYLTVVVGGGAVVTPVFYNGTNWVAH